MEWTIPQIIEGIEIASGDPRKARRWVTNFILSSMSSDALEYAVENNVDPWATVVIKYRLDHPLIRPLAQGLLREYWNGRGGLGETLSDVRKVANHLAKNPVNRELLKKPETIDWLNRAVTQCYEQLYTFTWES